MGPQRRTDPLRQGAPLQSSLGKFHAVPVSDIVSEHHLKENATNGRSRAYTPPANYIVEVAVTFWAQEIWKHQFGFYALQRNAR